MAFPGRYGSYSRRDTHGMAREKGVRKVFPNSMVAHVWAQQNQSEGRSNNGNFWFRDDFLYSYSTAIARIVATPAGEKVMLIRDEKFSVSTSQHMPSARVFDGKSFSVPFIGSTDGQTAERRLVPYGADFHAANVRVFWTRWCDHVAALRKRAAYSWESDLQAIVAGHRWIPEGETRPADFEAAVAYWQNQQVLHLMDYRRFAETYAQAFGLDFAAVALEFAASADAESLARTQVAEIVAKFRATLDNPKNKAARERSAAKRAEETAACAETLLAQRAHWLATPDAELIQVGNDRHWGRVCAPTLGYRVDGYTRAQIQAAERTVRDRERDNGIAAAIEQKEARIDFARKAAQREKEAADFAAWQRGEDVYCPPAYRVTEAGGAYLRVRGDELETSQGARVPVDAAVRVFKVAKAIREKYAGTTTGDDLNQIVWTRNGATLPVGHFQVDYFRADGSFKAGCHTINWPEIESAARSIGVYDLPGSLDSIVHRAAA